MPRPKQVARKAAGGTGYTQPIEEAQEQAASAASHAAALRKQLEGWEESQGSDEESDLNLGSDDDSKPKAGSRTYVSARLEKDRSKPSEFKGTYCRLVR